MAGSLLVGKAAPARFPWRTILKGLAVLCVIALIAVRVFVAEVVRVRGNTMAPNALEGDVLLVLHQPTPALGDVVLLDAGDDQPPVLRRVVGRPGDRMGAQGGLLLRNDLPASTRVLGTFVYRDRETTMVLPRRQQQLVEQLERGRMHNILGDHVGAARAWTLGLDAVEVPAGSLFVLCDNRRVCPADNRRGLVPAAWVKGVATSLLWYGDARESEKPTAPFYGAFVSLGSGPGATGGPTHPSGGASRK